MPISQGRRGRATARALAFGMLAAAAAIFASCAGRESAEPEPVYRFIDHLEEARVEGAVAHLGAGELPVLSESLEWPDAAGRMTPFVGFKPPPEGGERARAVWRAARSEVASGIARGPEERVAGGHGLSLTGISNAEFSGVRTGPILIEPGATYRARVWMRTDALVLPEPSVGATLLVYGLALGARPDSNANERLEEAGYFMNRAVLLEEVEVADALSGSTQWQQATVVVRTNRRVDHVMIALVAHGPQPLGRRAGAVRFDDLTLSMIVPGPAALPPLTDHFTGGPNLVKKRVRLSRPIEAAGAAADARVEETLGAILAAAPGRILYSTRIPKAARLEFAFALPPSAADGAGVTFAVDVVAGGRSERVFEESARPAGPGGGGEWKRATVDLSRFAGKSVTVALVTEREAGAGAGAALWGEPVLYGADAAGAGDAGPVNVLLISIDTLRRDHLGCYGLPRRVSPEIDRLAAAGTIFETCVSGASWTLPAHATMLTGLSPAAHRLTVDERRLGASRVTLAELMRRAGHATGGFVTHYYVSGDYGLDRGFETFDYSQELPAGAMCDRAGEWIARSANRPFFCFLHLFDPHWDYAPPEPYAAVAGGEAAGAYRGDVTGQFDPLQPWIDPKTTVPPADLARALDLYNGEIASVDAALGRLFAKLDSLGLAERTLVLVTSDHGEEFREHGSFGHGHTLYEEVVAVPLVVRGPGGPGKTPVRADEAASIDLAPTILARAGVGAERIASWIEREASVLEAAADAGATPPTPQWEPEGRDLFEAGAEAGAARVIVSETERFGTWRVALRKDAMKFISPGQYQWWIRFVRGAEIYDIAKDPGETRNLVGLPEGGPAHDLGGEAVRRYLARHRGVIIVARGADGESHRMQARITGAQVAQPTGIGLEPDDAAEIGESGTGAEISCELSPGDVDIILVSAQHPERLYLAFSWDGAPATRGALFLGASRQAAARQPIEIAPGARGLAPPAPEAILAWEGPGIWVMSADEELGTSFTLDEEELARLRALGYID